MRDIREYSKALGRWLPEQFLGTIQNYAVLSDPRLLPAESVSLVGKKVLYQKVLETIGLERPLLLLEFGVFEGSSLRKWCDLHTHPDSRIVGFDSFTGLPLKWRARPAGYFSVDGRLPAINDPRVTWVPGWFNETLEPWWEAHEPDPDLTPLVHIDCDLYSSALYLLTRLHDYWPRYHVVFDDYPAGEARALRDYLDSWGARFIPVAGRQRQPYSRVPGQVYGIIETANAPS